MCVYCCLCCYLKVRHCCRCLASEVVQTHTHTHTDALTQTFTQSGPLVPSILFFNRPGAAKQWVCASMPLWVCVCVYVSLWTTAVLTCPWAFFFVFFFQVVFMILLHKYLTTRLTKGDLTKHTQSLTQCLWRLAVSVVYVCFPLEDNIATGLMCPLTTDQHSHNTVISSPLRNVGTMIHLSNCYRIFFRYLSQV